MLLVSEGLQYWARLPLPIVNAFLFVSWAFKCVKSHWNAMVNPRTYPSKKCHISQFFSSTMNNLPKVALFWRSATLEILDPLSLNDSLDMDRLLTNILSGCE